MKKAKTRVVFVALTYVLEPNALGEQKSKAAQLGLKRLMEAGIMPHIIACRASNPVKEKVREKISMFSNVPMRRVVSMHDVESIYLDPRNAPRSRHGSRSAHAAQPARPRRTSGRRPGPHEVALVRRSHRQGQQGSDASASPANTPPSATPTPASSKPSNIAACIWASTCNSSGSTPPQIDRRATSIAVCDDCHGIIVPGGFGVRGIEGKIECIRYARENRIPFLGICLGFQMAVIEFARNVCGIADANSTEFDPSCKNPVIDILPDKRKSKASAATCASAAKTSTSSPAPSSPASSTTPASIRLRFRHRYEVDPKYIATLEQHGLIFSGKHPSQPIMQMLELPQIVHPYFVGTQAHPS